ncbi:MAG: phosphate/phosphite/phosphonate ABC transporter substrate-binding protein [Deltaproteobacteria bacterium]|nr:MAG: phosphate/phosphite/phosphonate ABC transporter substrate-binding protein [Deltaproteobacteria bacterium]
MKYIGYLNILILLLGCNKITSLFGPKIGGEDNPISIFFPRPISGDMAPDFSPLVKYLEQQTGLYFKITIPKSMTGMDDGFYNKIIDIALVPPLKYLDLSKDYGVTAKLKILRYNKDYYQSMFIINKEFEDEIKDLSDLKGKTIAFTHHDSASGYIIPHEILYIRKIVPKDILFAFSHKNVVNLVYKKEVEAGVTFYQDPGPGGELRDGRFLIKDKYPDVADQIKVLYVSGKIPNDPLVFRKEFPEKIGEEFLSTFSSFLETPEGKNIFSTAYNVEGFLPTDDIEYDDLRMLMKEYFKD